MPSPADNGTLTMWDYATGLPFQHMKDIPQPGSLDAEAVSLQMPAAGGWARRGTHAHAALGYAMGCYADEPPLSFSQGVFCSAFDRTGTRLITGGADKTIKVYSEMA